MASALLSALGERADLFPSSLSDPCAIFASPIERSTSLTAPQLTVTGKLVHKQPIQVEDFQFVKSCLSHGDSVVKVAIPSPTMIHFRGGRAAIDINSCTRLSLARSRYDALPDFSFAEQAQKVVNQTLTLVLPLP